MQSLPSEADARLLELAIELRIELLELIHNRHILRILHFPRGRHRAVPLFLFRISAPSAAACANLVNRGVDASGLIPFNGDSAVERVGFRGFFCILGLVVVFCEALKRGNGFLGWLFEEIATVRTVLERFVDFDPFFRLFERF